MSMILKHTRPFARISFQRQYTVSSILLGKRWNPQRQHEILLQQQQRNPPIGQQRENPFPEQPYFSGRIRPLCLPDPEKMSKKIFLAGFNDIQELQNANENVKKIFSLEMGTHREVRKARKEVYREMYETPLEAEIAMMTNRIREMVLDFKEQRDEKNKAKKEFFMKYIHRRKNKLKTLKREHLLKYHNIIKELDIPPLESVTDPWHMNKSRKNLVNVPLAKKRRIEDFEEDFVY